MKTTEAETINRFSKRSDPAVMYVTVGFALGGAFADLVSHSHPALFGSGGIGMLWALWIPLCFVTIPPIHYLCRQVVRMRERLEALERRTEYDSAGSAG